MTCTDADLERLKELRKQGYHTYTAWELNEVVTIVDALIARMRTAENLIIKAMAIYDNLGVYPGSIQGYGDHRDYKERDGYKNGWNACGTALIDGTQNEQAMWRKAAGK